MPLISIIVPVYKVEPYIYRCVDSILTQTFQNFELILVDDGSPDNCGAICDEYAAKDGRIHVIHQANEGLSAARNAGIDWLFANSDSRWITFVDSDDWIHNRFLEYLLKAVEDTHCLMSACYAFWTEGEDFSENVLDTVLHVSSDDYYCGDKSGGVPSTAWAKLYARQLFDTLRYPVGKLHEDEFTTYKAVYASENVAVIPLQLYAYYQNPEGIIRSKWNPRRMDGVEAIEQQMSFAEQIQNPKLQERAFQVYTWFLLNHLMQIRSQKEIGQDVQACRKELQRRLRSVMHKGSNRGKYPFCIGNLWVYEEAYPVTILWNAVHGVSRAAKRLLKK